MRIVALSICLALAPLSACPDEPEPQPPCDPQAQTHCAAGTVCEYVADGTTACFAPIEIRGMVFDSVDGLGIGGATVVALDANGSARSTVATTAPDGTYRLAVPAERNTDGTLTGNTDVTLRADAADYQPFPKFPRTALPVDIAVSTADGDPPVQVVQTPVTDIALIGRVVAGSGTITGTVVAADPGGVLVVALQGGRAVSSAISDSEGIFTLFDVPGGSTDVTGYRAGLACDTVATTVVADATKDVVVTGTTNGLATVSGNIQIVNAPGGATTSVILAPKETFDAVAIRGEAPAGLRAAGIAGDFSIPDVPPGTYIALAAFENDDLVRDPDTTIGGTQLVEVVVDGSTPTVVLPASFKVTEALATVSPGATVMEEISTATPTFEWADDSSEDGYEVRVYDAFGTLVWEKLDVPGVSGSATVTQDYGGPALEAGMVYQFRAWSFRDKQGNKTYISTTEDLRGVFMYAP